MLTVVEYFCLRGVCLTIKVPTHTLGISSEKLDMGPLRCMLLQPRRQMKRYLAAPVRLSQHLYFIVSYL